MPKMSEKEYEELLAQGVHKEIVYSAPADGDDYTYEVPDVGKEKEKKPNKYGARKVEYDGIKFDSTIEMERYKVLKLLESVGEIHDLELQPSFTLLEKYEWRGVKYRATTYKADFKYKTKDDRIVVEDVKGKPTPEFKLKWKWLMYVAKEYGSPIRFLIVTKAKGQWMEFDDMYEFTKTFHPAKRKDVR